MTRTQTTDPWETAIVDALRADAENAPALPEDWHDSGGVSISPTEPSRTRWVPAIFGAAAAALLVVALGLVAGRPFEGAPAAAPPPWVPPGSEFASTDLGPATRVYNGPVVAALTRQIGVEGHPPQVVTTSLTYMGNATAIEQVCTSEYGSSGCRPEWNAASWSVGVTSSVDNGVATFDLWTIEGVPADAAFVSYSDGDVQLWQRPIMGFVAFPNVAGDEQIVIAYDADGSEIGRVGAEQEERTATLPDGQTPPLADISQAEFTNLVDLTAETARDCLTSHGGTLVGDIATFPADVDQAAVWDQCVAETKQVVGDAVNELNPPFYDWS